MVETSKIEEFTSEAIEKYEEDTVIGKVCSREIFEPSENGNEFVQLGIRTGLPMEFFTKGHIPIGIANDFVKSIQVGERNHFLTELNERKDTESIVTTSIDSFSPPEFKKSISKIDSPTDIFLPVAFSETLYSWIGTDIFEFDVTATYLDMDSGQVRIRWVPDKHGFEDIFVVNSSNIDVVQKPRKYADDVEDIAEIGEYQFNSPDDFLMVYFGEPEERGDEFEFLIRTVVSEPIITGQSASVIDTSNIDVDFEKE